MGRRFAVLGAILVSQWGCYFLVDRDGIVGTVEPEAGANDAGSPDVTTAEEGLLAYWSFDESNDGVVQDLSGGDHHGTVGSDALVPGGWKGQALGASMTVPALGGQNFPPRGTLSFWLRGDFTGAEKDGREFFGNYDPSRSQIFVRVPNAISAQDALVLQLACQAPRTSYPFAVEIPSPQNNRWMHLAFVWDSDAHRAAAYLDGEALQTGSLPESWRPSDQQVVFGRDLRGMLLDEARLYGRAMSAEEVKAIP